jgi:hypothetical protein
MTAIFCFRTGVFRNVEENIANSLPILKQEPPLHGEHDPELRLEDQRERSERCRSRGRRLRKEVAEKSNPYGKAIEQQRVRQWPLYLRSIRYASAMAGPDYATFKNGWWELTNNLQRMHESLKAPHFTPSFSIPCSLV